MKTLQFCLVSVFCGLILAGCNVPEPKRAAIANIDPGKIDCVDKIYAQVHDKQFSDYQIPLSSFEGALFDVLDKKNISYSQSQSNGMDWKLDVYLMDVGYPAAHPKYIQIGKNFSTALSIWKCSSLHTKDKPFIYFSTSSEIISALEVFVGSTRLRKTIEKTLQNNLIKGLASLTPAHLKNGYANENSLVIMSFSKMPTEIKLLEVSNGMKYEIYPAYLDFLHSKAINDTCFILLEPGEYIFAEVMYKSGTTTNTKGFNSRFTVDKKGAVYMLSGGILNNNSENAKTLSTSFTEIDPSLKPIQLRLTEPDNL